MKTFNVKYLVEFETQVAAEDVKIAEILARASLKEFPKGTTKLLSIISTDIVEAAESVSGSAMSEAEKKMLARNDGLAKNIGKILHPWDAL